MSWRSRTWLVCATVLLLGSAGAAAQQGAPVGAAGNAPSPKEQASALIQAGDCAKALDLLQGALAKSPQDLDLLELKVRALMGLRQYKEAANFSWGLAVAHLDRPWFREAAGLSAFRFGAFDPALKAWKVLSQTPGWEATGYENGVQSLAALGREAEALAMLHAGLERVHPPAQSLVADSLDLEPSAKVSLAALDAYRKADPKAPAFYQDMRQVYAALGDVTLCRCDGLSGPSVRIPLQEKSERQEVPTVSSDASGQVSSWTEMSTGASVTVPVVVDGGSKSWMTLDSGSDTFLIPEELADELKLQPLGSVSYRGLGPKAARSAMVLLKAVQIGPLTFHDVPAVVIPKKADFWARRGLVPLSLLKSFALLYDRRHSRLDVYPSGTDPAPLLGKGGFRVPSLWFSGEPYVLMRIQEAVGLYCLLDTGAAEAYISGEHAPEVGVKVNSGKWGSERGLGVTGAFTSGQAEQVTLGLGLANFHLSPIQVMPLGLDRPLLPVYGIVGRKILDPFVIFFDYPRNVIAFKAY